MREQPKLAVLGVLTFPLTPPAQHVPQILVAGPADSRGPLRHDFLQERAESPLPIPRLVLFGKSRQGIEELLVSATAIAVDRHKAPLVRPTALPGQCHRTI